METRHRGQSGINDRRRRAAVETRQPRFHNGWREPRRIPGRVRPGGSASDNKGLFPVAGRGTGWHVTTLHTSCSTWNRAATSYQRPRSLFPDPLFSGRFLVERCSSSRRTFTFVEVSLPFFDKFTKSCSKLTNFPSNFSEEIQWYFVECLGGVLQSLFRNFQHLSKNNFRWIFLKKSSVVSSNICRSVV